MLKNGSNAKTLIRNFDLKLFLYLWFSILFFMVINFILINHFNTTWLVFLLLSLAIAVVLYIYLYKKMYNKNHSVLYLLAMVVHEMRNPLNRLLFSAELLNSNNNNGTRKQIQSMLEDIEQLNTMTNEILLYSKLNSIDNLELNISSINFDNLFIDIKSNLYALPKHANISMHIANQNYLFDVKADEFYLKRCIQNLVFNANKYAKNQIVLTLAYYPKYMEVIIEDDGCGINDDQLNKVFEPFKRLENGAKSVGYGLGLSIVNTLAIRQGFNVRASNSNMGGAKFSIHIKKPLGV